VTVLGIYLSSTDIILFAVNALVATSLYLTMIVGVFSLGQVAFMAIGAYGFAYTTTALGWAPWLSMVAGALAALAAALLTSPILRVSGIYLGILTIALIYVMQYAVGATEALGQVSGLYGPLLTEATPAWIILVFALAVLVVVMRLPLGMAMRAIGEDDTLARSVGVFSPGVKVVAFAIGGLLAGLAGAINSYSSGYTAPALYGVGRAIEIVLYAVVGGFSAPINPAVGAVVLTLLGIILRRFNEWGIIISGLLVLVLIVLRPKGLLVGLGRPLTRRLDVLRRAVVK